MKQTIIMQPVYEAEDMKKLERFTLESVKNMESELSGVMMRFANDKGEYVEVFLSPEGTYISDILEYQEDNEEDAVVTEYLLNHLRRDTRPIL